MKKFGWAVHVWVLCVLAEWFLFQRWAGLGNHSWNACVRNAPNQEAGHTLLVLLSLNTGKLRVGCRSVSESQLAVWALFESVRYVVFAFTNTAWCACRPMPCAHVPSWSSVCALLIVENLQTARSLPLQSDSCGRFASHGTQKETAAGCPV